MQNPNKEELKYLERVIEERERSHNIRFDAIQKSIDEKDRLYDTRFKAAEVAVSAALAAAEKAVASAFIASEKAVLKAEQAQKEYNERSNEFRGQLDDQAKTLMPRPETLNMFKALEEKIIGVQNVADSKLDAIGASFHNEILSVGNTLEKSLSSVDAQIISLRESRSGYIARDTAMLSNRDQHNWSVGLTASVVLGVISAIIALAALAFAYQKH